MGSINNKPAFVQVVEQATNHYLNQCLPSSMMIWLKNQFGENTKKTPSSMEEVIILAAFSDSIYQAESIGL